MERIKKPILALLSAGVFWILAIASSPPVGQSVDCTMLPEPVTNTHYVLISVADRTNDQQLQNVTVKMELKNIGTVEEPPGKCTLQIVSTSESILTTNETGSVEFTIKETKKASEDYVQAFFTISKPGYNEETWSFSSYKSDGSAAKYLYLTPIDMYP